MFRTRAYVRRGTVPSAMADVLANAASFRQPCALKDIVLPGENTFSCHESCSIPRQVPLSIVINFRPNSF